MISVVCPVCSHSAEISWGKTYHFKCGNCGHEFPLYRALWSLILPGNPIESTLEITDDPTSQTGHPE